MSSPNNTEFYEKHMTRRQTKLLHIPLRMLLQITMTHEQPKSQNVYKDSEGTLLKN